MLVVSCKTSEYAPLGASPNELLCDVMTSTNARTTFLCEGIATYHPGIVPPGYQQFTSSAVHSAFATVDLMTFATLAGADTALRKDVELLRRLLARLESDEGPDVEELTEVPSLDEVERGYIDNVVQAYGGIRAASRVLGMHRSTLQRKLRKDTPVPRS